MEKPHQKGQGPDAIGAGATYYEIAREAEARDLAQRSLGRWATEARAPLGPGEVPKQPSSSPWARNDLLGVDKGGG